MYTYNATVVKIVDGDTIDAEIDLGFDIKIKKRIRLGKYGRVLGKLHISKLSGRETITKVCVNDQLIEEGYAVEYDGGKR